MGESARLTRLEIVYTLCRDKTALVTSIIDSRNILENISRPTDSKHPKSIERISVPTTLIMVKKRVGALEKVDADLYAFTHILIIFN